MAEPLDITHIINILQELSDGLRADPQLVIRIRAELTRIQRAAHGPLTNALNALLS